MECPEVHAAIRTGRAADPAVAEHARSCPACAELLADGAGLGLKLAAIPPDDGPDLTDAVLDAVRKDRARGGIAGLPTWVRVALAATALVAAPAALVGWRGLRPDLGEASQTWLMLAGLALAALAVAAVPLSPLHRPAPAARGLRVALALAAPILFGVAAGAGVPPGPVGTAFGCLLAGAVPAAAVLAVLRLTERRRRVPPEWLAGAAGLAGLAATIGLDLTCPMGDAVHLALGHGAVGLAWASILVVAQRSRVRAIARR